MATARRFHAGAAGLSLLALSCALGAAEPDCTVGDVVRVPPQALPEPHYAIVRETALGADGRYVVFSSPSMNLDARLTSGVVNVFLRDRTADAPRLVSASASGEIADAPCENPTVSGDGRFVCFLSKAKNLVPGFSSSYEQVYLADAEHGGCRAVSASADGMPANSLCKEPVLSADGNFVAFVSYATNLVPDEDTNKTGDLFVWSRERGTIERISHSTGGVQADAAPELPSISADGRMVAFLSRATTLVESDRNGFADVFVRDRANGTTRRVSVSSPGVEANGHSCACALSPDGTFVAFRSRASNLVPDDKNNAGDVFLHELATGTTMRVNLLAGGVETHGDVTSPCSVFVSTGGRRVLFATDARELAVIPEWNDWVTYFYERGVDGLTRVDGTFDGVPVAHDAVLHGFTADGRRCLLSPEGALYGRPGVPTLFVGDVTAATLECVNDTGMREEPDRAAYESVISADGQVVAWVTSATTLVEDYPPGSNVYVYDRGTGAAEVVTRGIDGRGLVGLEALALSGDGRWLAYVTTAMNVVPDHRDGDPDVFLHDRATHETRWVAKATSYVLSLSFDGRYLVFLSFTDGTLQLFDRERWAFRRVDVTALSQGAPSSVNDAVISGDGSCVAFSAAGSSLVPGDTNQMYDVFVWERSTGEITRVSVSSQGIQSDWSCTSAALSADGRYVAFESQSTTFVPPDADEAIDVFLHDRVTRTTSLVSVSVGDMRDARCDYRESTISADGRLVCFTSSAPGVFAGWAPSRQAYLRDCAQGSTVLVKSGLLAEQRPELSANGRAMAFVSASPGLVPGDRNALADVFVVDIACGAEWGLRMRCDASGDGRLVINDAIQVLRYLFVSGTTLPCATAGDCNGDGKVQISDAVFLLGYLFAGGASPAPPFPGCEFFAGAGCASACPWK